MRIRRSLLVIVALLGLAWAPPIAHADELTDVAAALGVANQPTEYVVVLDTSASMEVNDAWGRAVAAVTGLATSLENGDRLSVVTFDEFTTVAWQGEHPVAAADVAAALPVVPEGERTDIGAGLAVALDVLEESSTRDVAAVVLMTDGEITTEPDSLYKTMDSPAWDALGQRAAALPGETAAYALGLAEVTDAAAMQRVFPKAELVDEVQLEDYLSGLARELLLHRLESAVAPDDGAELQVAWKGDAVTITSPLTWVPVELTGLELSNGAGTIKAPAAVTIAPGASVTLPVAVADGFAGRTTLVGVVTSPWQTTLEELAFAMPTVSDAALTIAAAEPSPQQPAVVSAAPVPPKAEEHRRGIVLPALFWPLAAGATALLALGILGWMVSRPRMSGSLTLQDSQHRRELALSGRRMVVPENPMGIRGHVRGRRGATSVRVHLRPIKGRPLTQVLMAGQSVRLGDVTLTHLDERAILEERLGLTPPG